MGDWPPVHDRGHSMTGFTIGRKLLLAAAAALALTGCTSSEPSEPIPTGDELVAQAKQHYLDYRTITNDVQALIFDGPWEADIGSYGMQPDECSDDSYAFDFTRTTRVPAEDHERLRSGVLEYLDDAGYEVDGRELGSGTSQSQDVIVQKQQPFSKLTVTFIGNGSVLVTAITACWPGDRDELGDLIFGDVNLSQGYLPLQESPSDPLFFGITPGQPAFTPTPTPVPVPMPTTTG